MTTDTPLDDEKCIECGMLCHAGEYHPYAACLMFMACHDSTIVRANLSDARTLERDLSECRAALAERQAAIDELVACDDILQEVITAGRANPHSTKNWPQIHGRNVAAWSTARALATKEPTK